MNFVQKSAHNDIFHCGENFYWYTKLKPLEKGRMTVFHPFKLCNSFKNSYTLDVSTSRDLLVRTQAKSTTIHQFSSGKELIRLTKPTNPSQVQFSEGGNLLIISSTNGNLYVYATSNFELLHSITSTRKTKIVEAPFSYDTNHQMLFYIVEQDGIQQLATYQLQSKNHQIHTAFDQSQTFIHFEHFSSDTNQYLYTVKMLNRETDFYEFSTLVVSILAGEVKISQNAAPLNLYWNSIKRLTSRKLYLLARDNIIELRNESFDILFELKFSVPSEGYFVQLSLSKNEKFAVITYSTRLFLIRLKDNSVILEQDLNFVMSGSFSETSQHLLIGTAEAGYVVELEIEF